LHNARKMSKYPNVRLQNVKNAVFCAVKANELCIDEDSWLKIDKTNIIVNVYINAEEASRAEIQTW